jgi:hypothetical protein
VEVTRTETGWSAEIRIPTLSTGAERWSAASDGVGEAGLDVKVGLTANLTLNLSGQHFLSANLAETWSP